MVHVHACRPQEYHGVVRCALGWACWRTYLGRSEADELRRLAMNLLGSGLSAAGHREDGLSVQEAELSLMRRIGTSEQHSHRHAGQSCGSRIHRLDGRKRP